MNETAAEVLREAIARQESRIQHMSRQMMDLESRLTCVRAEKRMAEDKMAEDKMAELRAALNA